MDKKPVGRPRKNVGVPRINVTTRLRASVHLMIAKEAEKNGRSVSEEVEARLEASFTASDMRQILREEVGAIIDAMLLQPNQDILRGPAKDVAVSWPAAALQCLTGITPTQSRHIPPDLECC